MATPTRAELLTIARQQIFNEYIDRAKQLDSWLVESERAWKEEGIKIAYPSFPIYPFDGEVEERADLLKQQLTQKLEEANSNQAPAEQPKVEEIVSTPVELAPVEYIGAEPEITELPKLEEVIPEVLTPELSQQVPELLQIQEVKSNTGVSVPVYYKKSKKRWGK